MPDQTKSFDIPQKHLKDNLCPSKNINNSSYQAKNSTQTTDLVKYGFTQPTKSLKPKTKKKVQKKYQPNKNSTQCMFSLSCLLQLVSLFLVRTKNPSKNFQRPLDPLDPQVALWKALRPEIWESKNCGSRSGCNNPPETGSFPSSQNHDWRIIP